MKTAEARELGVFETGDRPENADLLGVLQLRLEADHVPKRAERVVLAKLHDGVRPTARARIVEADRLHRTKAQRFAAALRHHLDRQAAVEVGRRCLPLLERRFVAREQRVDEGLVFGFRHRAIQIVGAGSGRSGLVIARLKPGDRRIDAVAMHDGGDRVEEGEESSPVRVASAALNAGDVSGPVATMTFFQSSGGRPSSSPRSIVTSGFCGKPLCDFRRERIAIDGECAAGRKLVLIARGHDQRPGAAHLLVQKADGIVFPIVGAERVRADEFGKAIGFVGFGPRSGRISCSTTGTPADAIWCAASEPARPAPTT